MISLNNISVAFGSFTLLDNISLHIGDSDKIGLVGKNGAGRLPFPARSSDRPGSRSVIFPRSWSTIAAGRSWKRR